MEAKKTIHARMAAIKEELSKMEFKKSGVNKFAGFKYHELSDFMGAINSLNLKHGVNDSIRISTDEAGLVLTNVENDEDVYRVSVPYVNAEMLGKGGAPSNTDAIQRLGSTITYLRRYLYMTAYNIQENDGVDSQEQVARSQAKTKQPTPNPNVELLGANTDASNSKTTKELQEVWAVHPNLHKNAEFIKVVTARKLALQKVAPQKVTMP